MVSWANHIRRNNACGSAGISRILRTICKMKTFSTSLILTQTQKRLTLMLNNYCRFCDQIYPNPKSHKNTRDNHLF